MPRQDSRDARTLPLQPVLTLAEAAEYLRVPAELLLQHAEAGKVPGRRLGDQWIFSADLLRHWLVYPALVRSSDPGYHPEYFAFWIQNRLLNLEVLIEHKLAWSSDCAEGIKGLASRLASLEQQVARLVADDERPPPAGSRDEILALAGIWKDDPTALSILEEVDAARERAETAPEDP